MPPTLPNALAKQVLAHLGIETAPPTLSLLDALVDAYTRRVPWESCSRIVRKSTTPDHSKRPRWPETFWMQSLSQGTGGTCYESNIAFFALLRFLGYDGHLTLNNMGDTVGCHAAIIVQIKEQSYLVDVGLPVHVPLPLNNTAPTTRESPHHTYSATPEGDGRFLIERDRHPNSYCYTLFTAPVSDADYRTITTQDYSDKNGQFLHRVILLRVIDGNIWRFSSADGVPYHIEMFSDGKKTYYNLGSDLLVAAEKIAQKFKVDVNIVREALVIVHNQPDFEHD